MASIFSSLDSLVEGLVVSSNFPEYGSLIFFLLFFVIFSITFASTAFIPVFKGEDKMNNIRALIAFSIAFLSTIYWFDLLTEVLLFLGVFMVMTFFSSFAIITIIPKESRASAGKKVVVACAIICAILTTIIYFGYGDALFSRLDALAKNWSIKLQ